MFGIGWTAYFIRVFEASVVGVVAYVGLWLLGAPVSPLGYAGAALASVAAMHAVWIWAKTARNAAER